MSGGDSPVRPSWASRRAAPRKTGKAAYVLRVGVLGWAYPVWLVTWMLTAVALPALGWGEPSDTPPGIRLAVGFIVWTAVGVLYGLASWHRGRVGAPDG